MFFIDLSDERLGAKLSSNDPTHVVSFKSRQSAQTRELASMHIFFQGVRSRSRDIFTSLWRTSSTKLLRLEGLKIEHTKYC